MSDIVNHRYEFVYLFEVADGNPNGDPDAGNQPRVDPESGEGLVTDVCLKRKIRNFVVMAMRDGDQALSGYEIYVKERGILAHEQRRAYTHLGAEPGDRPNEQARAWMCQTFFDIRTFGAVMTTGKTDDGGDAGSRGRGRQARTEMPTEGAVETEAAARKPKPARAKPRQWNCGQVRGPVQLCFARSIGPILALEHAITRCALTNAGDTGREGSETDEKAATLQMGRKVTVPYALYRAHGFVTPHFAADTKFTEADLALLWRALVQMWDQDHSAARGRMAARGLYVFKHASPLGNAPAHRLFERIHVARTDLARPARSFTDFTVAVDRESLPSGVELLAGDCENYADALTSLAAGQ